MFPRVVMTQVSVVCCDTRKIKDLYTGHVDLETIYSSYNMKIMDPNV